MTGQLLDYIEQPDAEFWAPDEPEITSPSQPLMEKLVTDTHSAALMTAAVTSVINTFRDATIPRTPSDIESYIPDASGIRFSLDLLSQDAHLSIEARAALDAFFAHLEPCMQEMERYFSDARAIGVERAMALHRYSLASTWRLVCHSAADAVQELALETEDRLPDLYNLSAGILQRLLDAAARGQSPCVNAEGRPYLPALPQRRRGSRRILNQPASITTAEYAGRLFVRDVSQGGLGLDRVRRVKDGDFATVTLTSGRVLTGTIVWRKGARAGLRLTTPLPHNDPMLWE